MSTKKFPSELASRGTVLTTDKLLIHNITTGETEYTTVAELYEVFRMSYQANYSMLLNAASGFIESGLNWCQLTGGGGSYPNKIGSASGIPYGTPSIANDEWINDPSYSALSAHVATVNGGYDHINNQLAGTINGGGHNFLRYNKTGHSIIGGGSYNLISAGRSGIFSGNSNSITGDQLFSAILGGYNNRIVGSYSEISGGAHNAVSGNYSYAFGRHGRVVGNGSVLFVDASTAVDYVASGDNKFTLRFTGGYLLADGDVTIGSVAASGGNLIIGNNCSALTFTDRTPFYDGDAIAEIKKIKGNSGLIDHDSLPPFVQVDKIREIFEDKTKTIKGKKIVEQIKVGEEVIKERDLGAMISVLTKAIQQLTNRIEKLEKK